MSDLALPASAVYSLKGIHSGILLFLIIWFVLIIFHCCGMYKWASRHAFVGSVQDPEADSWREKTHGTWTW